MYYQTVRLLLKVMVNFLTKSGRARNQKFRHEWKWHLHRLRALQRGQPLTCKMLDGTITIFADPYDGVVGKKVFLTGKWEPAESAFIQRFVQPGMTVFDIGANIGAHSFLLAKRVGENGKVHAFEPTVAGTYLSRSLEFNHFRQISFNPIALGNRPGLLRLVRCRRGSEAFTSISTPIFAAAAEGDMDVPVDTLDNYMYSVGLAKIDLVKIDVEGAEILVLQGARKALEAHAIAAWLFEMNDVCLNNSGYSSEQLENLFRDSGYSLFLLDDDGWPIPYDREKVRKNRDVLALNLAALKNMEHNHQGAWAGRLRWVINSAYAQTSSASWPRSQ